MADTAVEEKEQQTQDAQADDKTQAQSAELSDVDTASDTGAPGSIDILLDLKIPIIASIGQTQISVRRLLQLAPGSVLELDKPIEAPADLYLKGTKFAAGKVVVVDGQFAIRIEQISGLGNTNEEKETAEA